jgi:hypothetical protein
MAVRACSELSANQARPLLAEAMARPGASVRVCVVRALLPLFDDPRPILREALFDASPAIRRLARWAAPRSDMDASAILQRRLGQELPSTKRDWLGVLGLVSELNVKLDPRRLMEVLRPACPTVRHAAVLQLRDEHLPQLLETLDDMSDWVA